MRQIGLSNPRPHGGAAVEVEKVELKFEVSIRLRGLELESGSVAAATVAL